MLDFLKLSQALNSRLCHEIAGLIGSISTSIELINASNKAIKSKADDILSITSRELTDLINFYRIAYGFSSEHSEVGFDEIERLCQSIASDKIKIKFMYDPYQQIDSELAKVIMCLISSGSKSIIREGSISVLFQRIAEDSKIRVEVSSKSLKDDPDKIAILSGKKQTINVNISNSHEYYTYYLIKSLNLNINIEQVENMDVYLLSTKSNKL